jgi:hypothetical protein
MSLLPRTTLHSDSEQFIYNLEPGRRPGPGLRKLEGAKRTRGKADNPGSRVGSRSSKKDTGNKGKRALLCKPSRDEDSHKPILAVMLDQGLAKKDTGNKGKRALLCKPRELLCKPSRDVDSCKPFLAVMLNQGSAGKDTGEKGIVMQTGQIYTETESRACKE